MGEAQNTLASRQAGWKVPPSAPLLSCCVSSFSNSDRGAGGRGGVSVLRIDVQEPLRLKLLSSWDRMG